MVISIRNILIERAARIGMKVPLCTWGPSEHILRGARCTWIILIVTESFSVAWLVQRGPQNRHYRGDASVHLPGKGQGGGGGNKDQLVLTSQRKN
jgi:hypothetical protein